MSKHKMLDLFHASNEEAGAIVLSDVLPAIVEEYGECIVGEGVATLAGNVIGAACPRVNNIRLGYKQNRLERNINRTFFHLNEKQSELEEKLLYLENSHQSYFNNITEMLLD